MSPKTKTLIKYGITVLIGLIITVLAAIARGLTGSLPVALVMRYLSDGLFVPGVLLTGFGALTWISTTGFFDMFAYAGHSLLVLFSSLKNPKDHETFFEYKMAKEAKRGKPQIFILLVGVGFILASFVCLFLYYNL